MQRRAQKHVQKHAHMHVHVHVPWHVKRRRIGIHMHVRIGIHTLMCMNMCVGLVHDDLCSYEYAHVHRRVDGNAVYTECA